MVCLRNHWVENYAVILGLLDPLISVSAPLEYPLFEGHSNEGVDDVANIGSRHLTDLPDNWERLDDGFEA